jgi:hypothetical protein
MADNTTRTATGTDKVATDKVTYSGVADADVQLMRPVLVTGAEGSKTVVDLPGDNTFGLDVDVTRLPALPAGTNNIGDVDVLTLPALVAGTANIGDVDIVTMPAVVLAAGTANIGDVDVLTMPAVVLAAGTANIGDVDVLTLPALPAGTNNIGDVDIVSGTITTVSTVTNVSQQGGVAISLNTGVRDAGTQRVTIATNDAVPVTFTGSTDVATQTTLASLLTSSQLLDDTVFTSGTSTYAEATSKGALHLAVRRDADTTLVDTTNEMAPLQVNAGGQLKVAVIAALPAGTANIGDVDVLTLPALPAGTNNIGDVDVLTLPALVAGTANIGDVDVLTLPAIPAGDNTIGRVKLTDGTDVADVLDLTNSNPLTVAIVDGTGNQITSFGGGTEYTEDAVAAADPLGKATILVRKDAPATVTNTDGDNVAQRGTNYGAAYVQVVSSAGAFVDTFGGGTQYTEDAVAATDPVGNATILVRADTPAALVTTDGDNVAQRGTNYGAAFSQIVTSAGAFVDTFGGGTQFADAAARGTATGTLAMVDDGTLIQSMKGDSSGRPAMNMEQIAGVTPSLNTGVRDAGTVRVTVATNDSVPVTFTGSTDAATQTTLASVLTAVQLIDDPVATLGTTTYTEAATKGMIAGVVRRDADTTLVDTTNEVAALQVNADGQLKVALIPALPAGSNNIGDVDVLTLPALPTGTNNIGDVDVLTLPALVAGTANIGDVDVLTVPAPLSTTGTGTEATALRVTIATDSTGLVSVDDNAASLSVDWNGTQPVTGSGTATGALRVEVANNGTGVIASVTSITNAVTVAGGAANASPVSGNPNLIAGRASAVIPTDVGADGDVASIWTNRNGAPVVTVAPHVGLNSDPWNLVHEAVNYTSAQTSSIVITGGASEKIVVTQVQIQAYATTAGTAILYFGTGAYARGTNRAIFDGEFAPSATLKPGVVLQGPFIAGTNSDDLMFTSVGNISITISVWYYVVT